MNEHAEKTRGKLFVFEGADGIGKSSLIEIFSATLRQQGESVEIFAFPGNQAGTLGKEVYDLHHKMISNANPTSLQ
ncbi:hypothetical protein JW979_01715, partial [bacterium]|nr:hypothetical protein [candidate division CSSED10-310 bacterium]